MATQSPFSMLESFFKDGAEHFAPPPWAVEESHRRIVLLLNHILMQEPQARERLVRQKGRKLLAQWQNFSFKVMVTPAGLLDLAPSQVPVDLTLTVSESSPWALVQGLFKGEKPAVRIEGDVQLAAEVNWLADHVRWDIEEDISRIVGDAPAHMLVQACRNMLSALKNFVMQKSPPTPPASPSESAA